MTLTGHRKNQKKGNTELEQFYRCSQVYLDHLKRKNQETFGSYIEVCKRLLSAGATILDCGCGIGMSSYLLTKEGFKVTGTDISPLFISEAKRKYGNGQNLKFFVQDVSKMSFPDCSFDAVCSIAMLEHVTDVKGVLVEMRRVLKNRGRLIIFMPNHLDPVHRLTACIQWRKEDRYKPWEATSRIKAFCQFIRTGFLAIAKAAGINKKIYYIEPVLSNDENICGEDFDTTWLANWFDVENILRRLGFSIEDTISSRNFESRILRAMKVLRLPKGIQSFYIKIRATCVVVGVKNESSSAGRS